MNCGLLAYGPGLSVRCIQGLRRGVGKQLKKYIYFKGKEEKRKHVEGNKDNIEEQRTNFEGTEKQANLFQRNRYPP